MKDGKDKKVLNLEKKLKELQLIFNGYCTSYLLFIIIIRRYICVGWRGENRSAKHIDINRFTVVRPVRDQMLYKL